MAKLLDPDLYQTVPLHGNDYLDEPTDLPQAEGTVSQFPGLAQVAPAMPAPNPAAIPAPAPVAPAPAAPQGPSLEDQFAQALEESRKASQGNNVLKAANQIATGAAMYSGAKPDLSGANALLDEQAKQIGQKATNLEAGQKFGQEVSANKLAAIKTKKATEDEDPNSDASKAFRKAVEAVSPETVKQMGAQWSQVAASDQDLIWKPIDLKEKIAGRKDIAEQNRLAREASAQEKAIAAKEKAGTPSDKQVDTMNKYNAAISQLNSIAAAKPGQHTGRGSNIQNTMAQFVNMDDAQKTAFKAQVTQDLVQNIKDIAGTRPNPKEMQLILQGLPNMNDSDESFMTKLAKTRDNLVQKRDATLAGFKAQGKSSEKFDMIEPYKDEAGTQKVPSQPKTVIQNGHTYTLNEATGKYE